MIWTCLDIIDKDTNQVVDSNSVDGADDVADKLLYRWASKRSYLVSPHYHLIWYTEVRDDA